MEQKAFWNPEAEPSLAYKRHISWFVHVAQDRPLLGTCMTLCDQWNHPGMFSNSTKGPLFPISHCLSQKLKSTYWNYNMLTSVLCFTGSIRAVALITEFLDCESLITALLPSPDHFQTPVSLWVAPASISDPQDVHCLSHHFGSSAAPTPTRETS